MTLPGGFALPVTWAVDSYQICSLSEMQIPEETADARMRRFAGTYLPQIMTAGKILDASETFAPEQEIYRLSGSYACLESIGRFRREETGETNE